MTIDAVKELRALLASASPAPWYQSDPAWSLDEEADTDLICAMRNLLPGVLDELERLRTMFDAARGEVSNLADDLRAERLKS